MKKLFAVLIVALTLAACGEEHGDLQSWMDEVARSINRPVPPLPELKVYQPLAYGVDSMLDPFNSAKIEPDVTGGRSVGEGAPDFEARELRNNIMERYPLEAMHMIGYLNINNQPMAAIEVDQIVKQVKVGDWLGLDFGEVKKVTEQEVVIEETIEGPSRDWIKRSNTLQLQAKEDGK